MKSFGEILQQLFTLANILKLQPKPSHRNAVQTRGLAVLAQHITLSVSAPAIF